MRPRKRLIENIGSLTVLQGANYILPLITLPYLVRVLGPEKFGLIAFAQAFMRYFVVLTDYGFNLSATRQIAIHRDDSGEVSRIFSSVMVIKSGLIVLSFLLMSAIVCAVPRFHADQQLYFICFLTVVGNALFPTWLFQGMEKMRYITALNVGAKSAAVAAIFLFVRRPSDYLVAAGIQSGGFVLAGFLGIICLRSILRARCAVPSWRAVSKAATEGRHVFISTAAISLYTAGNAFVLGLIAGNTAVAYYSAADKLVRAVQGLLTPVSQGIYPHISSLVVRSREAAVEFIRKSLKWMGLFSFTISVLLFILAKPLVAVSLGEGFGASVAILRVMAFLPFIVAMSNVFGMQTMLTFGMDRLVSRVLLLAGLINLTIIVPLVCALGPEGAAISLLITETFVVVACWYVVEKGHIHLLSARKRPSPTAV